MIGQILSNRYKLTAELGNGGMAWVYMAQDLLEDQQVAVKILYPQLAEDLNFLQRFIQEAKLAMSLSQSAPQKHVARILDYGSDRDTHYLVMEYVEGRDLRHKLDQEGALAWQDALEISRQVALALEHAHQHGIVHRDIKPENIMVLSDGTIRVLDFGVARARTSPALTHSGFIGSPYYVAPEQAMGRPVDIRADIYSLGIVTYEMLAGKRPFESEAPWMVVNHHIATPAPMLEDVLPQMPDSVAQLVQKAMNKRPEDRFQTPAEMVQSIEAVLAGLELPVDSWAVEPDAVVALLDGLYGQATEAAEAGNWQEAVDLFSQLLRMDPRYKDVTEQLAEAGRQARLSALYETAQRSLKTGRWAQALAQLDEIAEIAPDFRDTQVLRETARHQEQQSRLYRQGVSYFEAKDWTAAIESLTQVLKMEPGHAKATELLEVARAEQAKLEELRQATAEGTGPHPVQGRPLRRYLAWTVVAVLVIILGVESYLLWRAQQPPSSAAVSGSATVTPTQSQPTPSPLPDTPVPTQSPTPILTLTPAPVAIDTPMPPASAALAGQIAFPRFDPARSTYDVHVCRVDGSGCSRVVAEASQPDFLPGGSRLVVHSWQPDDKGLSLLERSGQLVWKISEEVESARPSVDFQGNIYVYHSRRDSDRQARLYRTYDLETRGIKQGAEVMLGISPSWLPDGRILYSGCVGDQCGILRMNADGTDPQQVTGGGSETNPEASPDGQQVAFMSMRDGNWEVYVVNLDGSHLRRLTDDPANDGLPTWSPDGKYIAFVSDRDGDWAVWAVRSDGSGQRRLFELGGPLEGEPVGAAPHEVHGWVEERISWGPLP